MDQAEVLKFEQQVGKLKLSEAIRIGAKMKPKQGACYWSRDEDSCCALGAAAFGAGWTGYGEIGMVAFIASHFQIPCDIENEIHWRNVMRGDGWTREKIADWLESQGY